MEIYRKAYATWSGSSDRAPARQKKRKPDAPRRPKSAFKFFAEVVWKKVQKRFDKGPKRNKQIWASLRRAWLKLDTNTKKFYETKHVEDVRRYRREVSCLLNLKGLNLKNPFLEGCRRAIAETQSYSVSSPNRVPSQGRGRTCGSGCSRPTGARKKKKLDELSRAVIRGDQTSFVEVSMRCLSGHWFFYLGVCVSVLLNKSVNGHWSCECKKIFALVVDVEFSINKRSLS